MSGDLLDALAGQPAPQVLRVQYVHILRGWAATLGPRGVPWPREALRLHRSLLQPSVEVQAVEGDGAWWCVAPVQGAAFVKGSKTGRVLVLHSLAGWWQRIQMIADSGIWCYVEIDNRGKNWEGVA